MSATVRRDGRTLARARSPSRSTAPSRTPARPERWSVSTSASRTWPCCPPASWSPNPRHLAAAQPPAAAAGPAAVAQDRPGPAHRPAPVEAVAARRRAGWAGRTPGWRTCAATACTNSPPGWPASYGTVVVEDLNVAGMLAQPAPGPAHRRCRASPRSAGNSAYKTAWNGGQLHRRRPVVPVLQNLLGLRRW